MKKGKPEKKASKRVALSKKNYIISGAGLLLGIIGFVLVGLGEITISVILLVLGFVILLPVGLYIKP
ncbi:MAG TPA: hypothetical protein ENL43_02455 [candidate division WOR-3 bacterium]|uniref:DUF3098 domain-containing protein n=1 Tax=candidate division WOR-3 bacterium TaxID=2052148 RepID=A0A7V5HMX3_UNCW3|nr:hypothetical protein [candidate division WOR-3 bacterium]